MAYLYFKATEAQVKRAILRVIVFSIPLGENIFFSGPRLVVTERHIQPELTGDFHIDFLENRPVSIHIEAMDYDIWRVEGGRLSMCEQSWSRRYPTWRSALIDVPGIQFINPPA